MLFRSGNFHAILSDGMGSGSAAAIEGTLVSELTKQFLKFGINFASSLKLVNSVMLLNTKSESMSALDLFSVNLFTGEAKLTKAGAPATFIIRNGEVKKVNFSSLPIGILNDVSYESENLKLTTDDIVIMLSDGVTDIGRQWTEDLIKGINLENLTEISKYIVSKAAEKRSDVKDDDITAIVLRLSRSE